jgi:glycosyltransferase involved in cell wall biosynthesis
VIAASEAEAEGLRRRRSMSVPVSTIPNAVDTGIALATRPEPGDPINLLFVGNMDYAPNIDAAERLADAILPAIRRRLPDAELHLAGAGRGCSRMADQQGVRVHGFIADLATLFRHAAVAVVPLRAGGGTRLKLLLAEDDKGLVAAALRVATDTRLAPDDSPPPRAHSWPKSIDRPDPYLHQPTKKANRR